MPLALSTPNPLNVSPFTFPAETLLPSRVTVVVAAAADIAGQATGPRAPPDPPLPPEPLVPPVPFVPAVPPAPVAPPELLVPPEPFVPPEPPRPPVAAVPPLPPAAPPSGGGTIAPPNP